MIFSGIISGVANDLGGCVNLILLENNDIVNYKTSADLFERFNTIIIQYFLVNFQIDR